MIARIACALAEAPQPSADPSIPSLRRRIDDGSISNGQSRRSSRAAPREVLVEDFEAIFTHDWDRLRTVGRNMQHPRGVGESRPSRPAAASRTRRSTSGSQRCTLLVRIRSDSGSGSGKTRQCETPSGPPQAWLTIVGVSPTVRQRSTRDLEEDPVVYVPWPPSDASSAAHGEESPRRSLAQPRFDIHVGIDQLAQRGDVDLAAGLQFHVAHAFAASFQKTRVVLQAPHRGKSRR